ncbi:hypothetical protein A2Z67_05180 [Candidatus Woesebacteria bacterium RBG_13_36_22]|uniref:Lipoprotein n=1 Tax=Candidatus Woesebacteria bacterium RBG_13_36_22 TaxID=1802478 RepID=A0A1F7X4S9_9BACT|nr:MAG: hypothetical protein A2Z67_05180 [Candidatus Woesebacteria bacterium RBG_13_36_22]
MKKIIMLILLLVFCVGCAHMTYEPPKVTMERSLQKQKHYELPSDPFAGTEPPKAIFLAKADGVNLPGNFYKVVPKEEGELICYTAKEHDKIVLRISYYKEVVPALVRLVNIQIDLNNAHVQLVIDEELAKELYKQFWMDTENKRLSDKRWDTLEKGGLWAIILGQLVALIATSL